MALFRYLDNPAECARMERSRRREIAREADRRATLYDLHQDIASAFPEALQAERMSTRLKASTLKLYAKDIRRLELFCDRHGFPMRRESGALLDSVRPELLVKFLYDIAADAIDAGKPIPYRQIVRMLSAIGHLHKLSHYANPLGVLINPVEHLFVRAFLRHLDDVRQAIPGEQPLHTDDASRSNGNGHYEENKCG